MLKSYKRIVKEYVQDKTAWLKEETGHTLTGEDALQELLDYFDDEPGAAEVSVYNLSFFMLEMAGNDADLCPFCHFWQCEGTFPRACPQRYWHGPCSGPEETDDPDLNNEESSYGRIRDFLYRECKEWSVRDVIGVDTLFYLADWNNIRSRSLRRK